MSEQHTGFLHDFRLFFFRGLGVLLPSIVTLWILWQAFAFVFDNVAVPINRVTQHVAVYVTPMVVPEKSLPAWYRVTNEQVADRLGKRADEGLPLLSEDRVRSLLRRQNFRDQWSTHWYLRATGLAIAIVLIYLAGRMLGGLLGRKVYSRFENLFARVPVIKQVYPHVKQVVDLVMGEEKMAFRRVVLVEYPRKGIWTVGLVTGDSLEQISHEAGGDVLSVFIPSTPTPFTGFTISVPRAEVVDLAIPIDEAIRFIITAGVLTPGKEVPEELKNKGLGKLLAKLGSEQKPSSGDEDEPG